MIIRELERRNIKSPQNRSRQTASWVTKAGMDCAFYVGNEYNGIEKMFSDTVGVPANYTLVNYSGKNNEGFYPYQEMINALSALTGKQAYKYCALELLITLDLNVYKAVRRIIVPADIEFAGLHKVLQSVFGWQNYHLYDFTIFGGNEHKHMLYTYDMGDNWEHEIQLVRVINDYDKESLYLLEANGQTPPEDVGGIGGFVNFREIMLNPGHPEYREMKEWAKYWTIELSDWESHLGVIHN